jgi:hypothetical protein
LANTWNDIGIGTLYTTAISYDATAATIEGELELIYGVGEVTVVDDTDYTITFSMDVGDSDLVADFTSLTGASSESLTITQAFVAKSPLLGNNSGTLPCHCEIITTMETASTELKVTLQETSEYFELDYSLSSSDVVKWNTQSRTITVNDVDVRDSVTLDSQWFKLPVGDFTLVAEPSEVMLQATYRPRWI